jgi:hypothetical protein
MPVAAPLPGRQVCGPAGRLDAGWQEELEANSLAGKTSRSGNVNSYLNLRSYDMRILLVVLFLLAIVGCKKEETTEIGDLKVKSSDNQVSVETPEGKTTIETEK